MFVSLIMTMWIGFGQTIAKHYKAFSTPPLETSVEGCPAAWLANYTEKTPVQFDPDSFPHLVIYEVSYIWFSAIAFTICFVVGLVVSFATGADVKQSLSPFSNNIENASTTLGLSESYQQWSELF